MSSPRWIRWAAPAAVVGGLLWALFPLGTIVVDLDETQPGTLSYLATAALYWLMSVVPLLLLILGIAAMHVVNRTFYGRLGTAGFFVSFAALSLMLVGNAVEVASLTFSGSESDVGHSAFLIGFLLLLVGSALLGLALVRTRRDPATRAGGLLLLGALPLGILLAVVLGAVAPATDLGFWAAITVPYGIAWMLLGRALGAHRIEPAGEPARVT